MPTAHNNIDLSQVSVPAKTSLSAVPATVDTAIAAAPLKTFGAAAPLQTFGAAAPVQAAGAVSPVSLMSHVVDAPKLTVRFPSFVTPDKLVENSIDR